MSPRKIARVCLLVWLSLLLAPPMSGSAAQDTPVLEASPIAEDPALHQQDIDTGDQELSATELTILGVRPVLQKVPREGGVASTIVRAMSTSSPTEVTVTLTIPAGWSIAKDREPYIFDGHNGAGTCTSQILADGASFTFSATSNTDRACEFPFKVTVPAGEDLGVHFITLDSSITIPGGGTQFFQGIRVVDRSDLSATLVTPFPPVSDAGENLTSSFSVANHGPQTADAANVTVSGLSVPGSSVTCSQGGGACTGITLISGPDANGNATWQITEMTTTGDPYLFTVTTTAAASGSTTYTGEVRLQADSNHQDANTSNNAVTSTSTLRTTDLIVSLDIPLQPDPFRAGSAMSTSFSVTNLGPDPVLDPSLTLTVPTSGIDNLQVTTTENGAPVSLVTTGPDAGGTLGITLPTLATDPANIIAVTVTFDVVTTNLPAALTVSASGAGGNDTDTGNNSASASASLSEVGDLELTLSTIDGGQIPSGAQVCIDDDCHLIDSLAAAAVDSGTVLAITGIAPGTYPLTVQNAAPYLDGSGSASIIAGQTSAAAITLALPDPTATSTVTPTATTTATATATATVTTTATATLQPTRELPANIPTRSATATPTPTPTATQAVGTSQPVTQLPGTGTGNPARTQPLMLLLGLAVLILVAGMTGLVRNRN